MFASTRPIASVISASSREIRGRRMATRPAAMCASASAVSHCSPSSANQPASASSAAEIASTEAANHDGRVRASGPIFTGVTPRRLASKPNASAAASSP